MKYFKIYLFPAGFEPATLCVWGTRDNRYTTETWCPNENFYRVKFKNIKKITFVLRLDYLKEATELILNLYYFK